MERVTQLRADAQEDFTLIDKRFGTLAELRMLTTAAHARGIYVMVDVVVNHVHAPITLNAAAPKTHWCLSDCPSSATWGAWVATFMSMPMPMPICMHTSMSMPVSMSMSMSMISCLQRQPLTESYSALGGGRWQITSRLRAQNAGRLSECINRSID